MLKHQWWEPRSRWCFCRSWCSGEAPPSPDHHGRSRCWWAWWTGRLRSWVSACVRRSPCKIFILTFQKWFIFEWLWWRFNRMMGESLLKRVFFVRASEFFHNKTNFARFNFSVVEFFRLKLLLKIHMPEIFCITYFFYCFNFSTNRSDVGLLFGVWCALVTVGLYTSSLSRWCSSCERGLVIGRSSGSGTGATRWLGFSVWNM